MTRCLSAFHIMSRLLVVSCILVLATAMASPPLLATQGPLRVGDRMPQLKGETLTGRTAVLPEAAAGKVTLGAIGFTYQSRFPVEAWANWYRAAIDSKTAMTFFEVPMIGGMATLGRWFINRGMRSGTPVDLHDNVITVYGRTGNWQARLSYSKAHEDDAYLIVLDGQGMVRWLHHGTFDPLRADELKALLNTLASEQPAATDAASPNRPIEP